VIKVKVVTIKQPFATLIKEGIKEYEFRTWKTKHRGKILIHAGQGIDKKAMKKYEHLNLEYPSGQIIAEATLTDCIPIDEEARKMLEEKNPLVYSSIIKHKEWKGYGWKLENVKSIDPIPIKGKLSLWEYEEKKKIRSTNDEENAKNSSKNSGNL